MLLKRDFHTCLYSNARLFCLRNLSPCSAKFIPSKTPQIPLYSRRYTVSASVSVSEGLNRFNRICVSYFTSTILQLPAKAE